MTIVFYDFAKAPSPRRARIILAEKNIPHEAQQVDMMSGAQLKEPYSSINPDCTVPALQLEDGSVLCDNWGIALWAEAEQPDPPLMGETPAEKGLVGTWAARVDFQANVAFASAFRNSHPNFKGRAWPGPENYEQIPELAERGFDQLKAFLDKLERHMAGRNWIAIDRFSIADIWALTTLDAMRWIKAGPTLENHPGIMRWHDTISARDSARL